VRKLPGSRAYPDYNGDSLQAALQPFQIAYEHVPALGGRRPRDPTVDPARNAFWENQSFHNYADYATGAAFRQGLRHLLALGRHERCALMCAEAVWWRCHRRIIADHLIAAGAKVFHIGSRKTEPARLTAGAVATGHTVVYPAPEGGK
jgi:uncharacterized protein (DUF488 family)